MGCAAVGSNFTFSKKLNSRASNFTAEASAIYHATANTQNFIENEVSIITDSKSTIQAIIKPYPNNPIIKNIQQNLLQSTKTFNLCWVPAHVDIRGNERADALAKEAADDQNLSLENYMNSVIRSDLRAAAKRAAHDSWKLEWSTLQTNKLRDLTQSLQLLPNSSSSNREWERVLCRVRIGHCRMTHVYLMNREEPPLCDHCVVPLTISHFIVECPVYEPQRMRFFPGYRSNLKYFLLESDSSYQGQLFKFLKACTVFTEI